MTNSLVSVLCSPDEGDVVEALLRLQTAIARLEWPGEVGVEFHLAHGEWIDLLQASGFGFERLIEVYAQLDSKKHEYYGYVSPEWARRWPAEEIWTARKR